MNSRIRSYFDLGKKKRRLLNEAILFLLLTRTLLLILPVKSVMKISSVRKKVCPEDIPDLLQGVRWAILNAERIVFWKNNCLVKSLAGRWMLQRRGVESKISFGIKKEGVEKLAAHAWLTVGDVEVVDSGGDFKELINPL